MASDNCKLFEAQDGFGSLNMCFPKGAAVTEEEISNLKINSNFSVEKMLPGGTVAHPGSLSSRARAQQALLASDKLQGRKFSCLSVL